MLSIQKRNRKETGKIIEKFYYNYGNYAKTWFQKSNKKKLVSIFKSNTLNVRQDVAQKVFPPI